MFSTSIIRAQLMAHVDLHFPGLRETHDVAITMTVINENLSVLISGIRRNDYGTGLMNAAGSVLCGALGFAIGQQLNLDLTICTEARLVAVFHNMLLPANPNPIYPLENYMLPMDMVGNWLNGVMTDINRTYRDRLYLGMQLDDYNIRMQGIFFRLTELLVHVFGGGSLVSLALHHFNDPTTWNIRQVVNLGRLNNSPPGMRNAEPGVAPGPGNVEPGVVPVNLTPAAALDLPGPSNRTSPDPAPNTSSYSGGSGDQSNKRNRRE